MKKKLAGQEVKRLKNSNEEMSLSMTVRINNS